MLSHAFCFFQGCVDWKHMPRARESLFLDKSCLATICNYFNGSGCKYINVRDLNELTHARVGPILKSIIFGGFGMLWHIKHLWLSEERLFFQSESCRQHASLKPPMLNSYKLQTSSNIWGHQEEHLKSHEKTQLKLTDPSEIRSIFLGTTHFSDGLFVYLSCPKQKHRSTAKNHNKPRLHLHVVEFGTSVCAPFL